MRRKRILILVATLATVCVFLILQTFGKTGIGTRLEFETIFDIPYWSQAEEPARYVIQDNDTWASVWKLHIGTSWPGYTLPEVDFSNKTVIVVFMGVRRSTGYATEIKEIIDTGLSVVIRVEETYPGPDFVIGWMITSPCHFVETGKIGKLVIFDIHSRPGE